MAKRERHERAPMTISLDPETNERLRRYARQRHSTVSQIITDWVWSQNVKDEPAPAEAAKAGKQRYEDRRKTP